jgi:hypothetical protein
VPIVTVPDELVYTYPVKPPNDVVVLYPDVIDIGLIEYLLMIFLKISV